MAKRGSLITALLFLAALAYGCTAQHKVDLAAEEAAIRNTDAQWLAAATSHDLERVLRFWADDASILSPGSPAIAGKQAIRNYVSGAFATPGFSIDWKTDKIVVSQAGDMAYSTGTDRVSFTTPEGKSVTQENRAVAIWKKQVDGSWKCVVDVMNPAEPPAAK
jgi:uncharacterized protein (TIGR02246 family)